MSGDGIVSNELASIAGDAVDGTLMTFAPDPRKNPAAKELVEKFRAAGFEPEAYTLYSYAALQVIAEAAKTTGGNDPQAVAENIKGKGPFNTVIGEFGYDERATSPVRTTSCTPGRRVTTASTATSRCKCRDIAATRSPAHCAGLFCGFVRRI